MKPSNCGGLLPLLDTNKTRGALFSDSRGYRYRLWRIWDEAKPLIMFIGLNPSTANETEDDPTIRRVVGFAKAWGYGGVYMMNLFGWIDTDPNGLLACPDPVGRNDDHLQEVAELCQGRVVFAWGAFKQNKERAKVVAAMFPDAQALAINKDGSPKHPLYCRADIVTVPYKTATSNEATTTP